MLFRRELKALKYEKLTMCEVLPPAAWKRKGKGRLVLIRPKLSLEKDVDRLFLTGNISSKKISTAHKMYSSDANPNMQGIRLCEGLHKYRVFMVG